MSRGTIYVDTNGKRVEVCRGIGEPAVYIVARISKTGAQHRVKSPRLEPGSDERALQNALDNYAPEKGWKAVEEKKGLPLVQEPEVLPVEQTRDEYAERVAYLYDVSKRLAHGSVLCAAIAGAVMLQKKAALGHGKGFTAWKKRLAKERGISSSTADNYIALAREMDQRVRLLIAQDPKCDIARKLLGAGKFPTVGNLPAQRSIDVLAAIDPEDLEDVRTRAVARAVSQLVGEKSLKQLYFDWGILKPPHNPGGDHGGGKTRSQQWANPEAHRRYMAMADLREIANDMAEPISRLRKYLLESKRQAYLPMEVIEEARTAYTHYRLDLKDCLDALKQVKG